MGTPMVSHPLTTLDDLGGDTLGTATTQTRHNRTITVDFHGTDCEFYKRA
jgi:hypothetical protein